MTKAGLIAKVQAATGQSRKAAEQAVEAVFGAVAQAVQGGRFAYPGFGTFTVKERGEKTGRNPRTGKTIKIPARKLVTFKAAPRLKEKL